MTRWLVCAVAISCGQPAAREPLANHAPGPAAHACPDREGDGNTFAMTVSTDPTDQRASDDAFSRRWEEVAPELTAPCSRWNHHGQRMLVGIQFDVNRAGVVTEVSTHGRDPTLDRCVCDRIWSLTFPPLQTPLRAYFTMVVASGGPFSKP